MSDDLTHFDEAGRARMVNVGEKPHTERRAVALGEVHMAATTLAMVEAGTAAKGDVLGAARIAGIMASKRTSELIPLCHPVALTQTTVDFAIDDARLWVRATARCVGQTGVEMEALTAVSVAALTVYDMCKAVDRAMSIGPVFLHSKAGGKSGVFTNDGRGDLPSPEISWR